MPDILADRHENLENLNEHGTDNSSNQQYDINFFDVDGELAKIYRAKYFCRLFCLH
jgi:hypothetical protein